MKKAIEEQREKQLNVINPEKGYFEIYDCNNEKDI